jgi:hypothetical protein
MCQPVLNDFVKSLPATAIATDLTIGDGQTGNVTIPKFSKTDFENIVQYMQNVNIVVPNFVKDIIKYLNRVRHWTKSYYKFGITIPAHYSYDFVSKLGVTATYALIDTLQGNLSKAEKFMNFFGIPTEKVNVSDFDYQVVECTEKNISPKEISWYAHGRFTIYDVGAERAIEPPSGFSADGSESFAWYVKHIGEGRGGKISSLNDEMMNVLIRLFYSRNATYNKYGGLFTTAQPTTQNYVNYVRCDQDEASEIIGNSVAAFYPEIRNFRSLYKQTNTLNVSLTGTYLTADIDLSTWPLEYELDLKYGTLAADAGETLLDGILIAYMIDWLNFQSVKKDQSIHNKQQLRSRK